MTGRNEHQYDKWRGLHIDRRASTPLYQQVANTIRHRIATNEMEALSHVPSVRTMARFAEVTPATIARAYQILQAEGLLETVAGSGTVIADVRNIEHEAKIRSEEALARAVDQAITPLLDMHFSAADVLKAVQHRLENASTRNLIVVAAAKPVVDKYVRYLRGVLGSRYNLQGVLVAQLQAQEPETVERLRHTERCVTLLSLHQKVRELLAPYEVPISLLLTQLSLGTLHELEALSGVEDLRVGLVAEELYRPSVLATLGQYFAVERIEVATELNPESLERCLSEVDVCIYTLGVQEAVAKVRLQNIRMLELKFEVRQDSLERFLSFMEKE